MLNYFIDFINNGPLLAFGQSALFFYMIEYNQETLYLGNFGLGEFLV
jgi:hypothetical protein